MTHRIASLLSCKKNLQSLKKRPFAKKSDAQKYIKILSKRSCFFALKTKCEVLEPDFVLQNRLLILSFVTTPLLEDIFSIT